LRDALLCGATAMICAHNHPSGNLKPSEQDIRLTRKLKEAGDLMDVKLLDHILLGDQLCTEFYSFADQGVVF
jgi:DNA repair protein RadC